MGMGAGSVKVVAVIKTKYLSVDQCKNGLEAPAMHVRPCSFPLFLSTILASFISPTYTPLALANLSTDELPSVGHPPPIVLSLSPSSVVLSPHGYLSQAPEAALSVSHRAHDLITSISRSHRL